MPLQTLVNFSMIQSVSADNTGQSRPNRNGVTSDGTYTAGAGNYFAQQINANGSTAFGPVRPGTVRYDNAVTDLYIETIPADIQNRISSKYRIVFTVQGSYYNGHWRYLVAQTSGLVLDRSRAEFLFTDTRTTWIWTETDKGFQQLFKKGTDFSQEETLHFSICAGDLDHMLVKTFTGEDISEPQNRINVASTNHLLPEDNPEYRRPREDDLTLTALITATSHIPDNTLGVTGNERNKDTFMSCDLVFPFSQSVGSHVIFEKGGSGIGTFIGTYVIDGVPHLVAHTGDGDASVTATNHNTIVLKRPISEIVKFFAGGSHNVSWDIRVNPGRLRLWIDGELIFSGTTDSSGRLEGGLWAGSGTGDYLISPSGNVGQFLESEVTSWPNSISGDQHGPLRIYSNQTENTLGEPIVGSIIQGVEFDIKDTLLYQPLLTELPQVMATVDGERPYNIGPIVQGNPKNCTVFFNVEKPVATSTSGALSNTVTLKEHLFGINPPQGTGTAFWQSRLTGLKVRTADGSYKGTISHASYNQGLTVPIFDIDMDNELSALADGLLVIRYIFGLTNDSLIGGAVGEQAIRNTAAQIQAYLGEPAVINAFDFDENNEIDALTDGLLALRYLFGLTGSALTDNAVALNSPITLEEVIENLDNVMNNTRVNVTEDGQFISLADSGSGNAPTTGSANVTTLTIAVDSDSARDVVPLDTNLFIEAPIGGAGDRVLFNQSGSTDIFELGGGSSFRQTWTPGLTFVEEINTAEPIALIVPNGSGPFRAGLALKTNSDNAAEEFNAVSHGLVGPFNEAFQSSTDSNTVDEVIVENNIKLNDEVGSFRWKIQNTVEGGAEFEGTVDSVVVHSTPTFTNCTVLNGQSLDNLSSQSSASNLLVLPKSGGERWQAKLETIYRRNDDSFIRKQNIVSGTVGDSRIKEVNASFVNAKSNGSIVSSSGTELIGRDNLKINLNFLTEYTEAVTPSFYVLGELPNNLVISNVEGGRVEGRHGVFSILESQASQGSDVVYNILLDSLVFIPDGSPTWSARITLTHTMGHSSQPNKTFVFDISGTYSPEFGLETISPEGGTRLNALQQPLRFVASAHGEVPATFLGQEFRSIDQGKKYRILTEGTGHDWEGVGVDPAINSIFTAEANADYYGDTGTGGTVMEIFVDIESRSIPTGPSKSGWFDITGFTYNRDTGEAIGNGRNFSNENRGDTFDHTLELWWDGVKLKTYTGRWHWDVFPPTQGFVQNLRNGDQIAYDLPKRENDGPGTRPTLVTASDNTSSVNYPNNGLLSHRVQSYRAYKRFDVPENSNYIYPSDLTIPLNTNVTEENKSTFIVINSEPNSLVKTEIDVENNLIRLLPSNVESNSTHSQWDYGDQTEHLNHKYAIQVYRVGEYTE